jgi:hypothetical protein
LDRRVFCAKIIFHLCLRSNEYCQAIAQDKKEVIMKRVLFVAAAFVMGFAFPATTWSKGRTVKIEVRGDHLTSPIEITDPSVLKSFNIWNGPGVRINNEPVHMDPNKQAGAFIDWPKGMISERPGGLQRCEVLFYIEGRQPPHNRYIVLYEFDLSMENGYIYLPGRGDESGRTNTFLISHGVEGNWFRSSNAWEKLVRPIVEKRSR